MVLSQHVEFTVLIIMAGLPATGKSTLARALADRLHGEVLNKDEVRAATFSPARIEYSAEQDDLVTGFLLDAALYLLRGRPDGPVLLDGRTFSRAYQRGLVFEFAARHGLVCRVIECICAPEVARQRLESDLIRSKHPARNRNWELWQRVSAEWEPLSEPKLVVNTDQGAAIHVDTCIRWLRYSEGSTQSC